MTDEQGRARNVLLGLALSAADQVIASVQGWAQAQSEGIWPRAEHELYEHFGRLQDALRGHGINMSSGGGSSTDQEHPLHWYGSFRKPGPAYATMAEVLNAPRDPEIAISADVHRHHDSLSYACRISQDGRTLRQGPAGTIATPWGVIGSYARIRAALQQITGFIDDSEPFIREQLQALA